MVLKMTLIEALKEALEDDNKVSKYEAQVIEQIAKTAGHITDEERTALINALATNQFDNEARLILARLVKKGLTTEKSYFSP
jgi:uncharacterized tellurite resistance protein B-like protein